MYTKGAVIFSSELEEFLFSKNSRPLAIVDSTYHVVGANTAAQELFGYSEKEIVGLPVDQLYGHDSREALQLLLESVAQSDTREEMRQAIQALDVGGTELPVIIAVNRLPGTGDPLLLVSTKLHDIQKVDEYELQRTNSELERHIEERTQALRNSQELYKIVSRNFPNGIISVFDADYNYLFAEGKELFNMGITSKQLVGTNYFDRIPRSLHQEIRSKLDAVFQEKNQTFEVAYKDQHYILNATGIANSKGDIDRILLVEINNTNQKNAEREMRNAFEKERQLNELKSRFVAMASHEFRTPLSTILSSINLMVKYLDVDQGREKVLKHAGKIRASVQNLTSILNDFLSIDQLEEGKVAVHPEEFDLCELIGTLAENLEEQLKEGQEFQLILPSEQKVYQDPNVLRNVILNLFTNAIKYSHAGQDIDVKVWALAGHVYLEIADRGIGIPEAEQAQLFERFFRAKNALNLQGTGLGLNIVKRYVGLLQGKISFISKEHEGTTFTISFPNTYNHNHEESISN